MAFMWRDRRKGVCLTVRFEEMMIFKIKSQLTLITEMLSEG